MKIEIADVMAMEELGASISKNCTAGIKIFLQGDLGTGKTTLVRGFLRGLGHTEIVKSPTYTLVESYLLHDLNVHHFDLYRLNDPEELEAIGFRDYLDGQCICLLEWPEKAESKLGMPDLWIIIGYLNSHRQVELSVKTEAGASLLQEIS